MKETVAQIWGWDDRYQEQYFHDHFYPTESMIVVLDEVAVGVVALEKSEDAWFLANIEIAPEHQGHGLGTELVESILRQANEAGVSVALQVNRVNRARQLYERLGFETTGSNETHFLMRTPPRR
jgi:ribosomal protein S18 acetylase RimI-like enzyme